MTDFFTTDIVRNALVALGDGMLRRSSARPCRPSSDETLDFAVGGTDASGQLICQGNGDRIPRQPSCGDRGLDAYFQELQISGNADHTIIGRFAELCSAAPAPRAGSRYGLGARALRDDDLVDAVQAQADAHRAG